MPKQGSPADFEAVVEQQARKFHLKPESLRQAVVGLLPEAVAREIARQVATCEVSKPLDALDFPTPEQVRAAVARDKRGS